MMALRYLGLVLGTGLLVAVGCGDDTSTDDDGSGASGSGAAGAAGPVGSGGSTSATMTGGGGSAPLTCTGNYTDIPVGECDLLGQNCPAGTWCNVVDNGGLTTACVAHAGGLKGKGDPCTVEAECDIGLICLDQCRPVCCPDTNEPCDGGECNLQVDFGGGYAFMCTYNIGCTLFAGDCAMGTECHIQDADSGLAVCIGPSPAQVEEGEVCEFVNDCKESQLCNTNAPDGMPDEKGVCRHLCDTTKLANAAGEGGCLMGRTCVEVNAPGFPNLGICTP